MDILGLLLGIALIIADRAKDGALMKPSEDAKDEPPYSPLPEEVDSVNYPWVQKNSSQQKKKKEQNK